MQALRTPIQAPAYPFAITYQQPLMCIGSCFAERIGQRLTRQKFQVEVNPFGIVFNPLSIARQLEYLCTESPIPAQMVIRHQELWHSLEHHGRFSHPDKFAFEQQLKDSLANGRRQAAQSDILVLTLGSAHVFVHQELNVPVSNCHKLPAKLFERIRPGVETIVQALKTALALWKTRRPGLQVLISVSPVRYLREGLIENQRSKATLILAVDELCRQLEYVHYFPAYEMVIDDLRDYRFFETDMAHPTEQAVDYVWEHFVDALIPLDQRALMKQMDALQTALQHRPLFPSTLAHQHFIRQQLLQIAQLQQTYSWLNLTHEQELLQQQLL